MGNVKVEKAVGTNNFQAQGGGGMTTIDEHGDEAIWLPNESMVARNTTTLDMLNNLKSIKKNTRGDAKETGMIVKNNNHFVFNINGTDEMLQELKRELEKLVKESRKRNYTMFTYTKLNKVYAPFAITSVSYSENYENYTSIKVSINLKEINLL